MGAARGGPSPDELRLSWMCQRYPGALPEVGGIYDQDYKLMVRMAVLSNVYSVITRTQTLVGNDIHSLTSAERRLLGMVQEMELL